MILNVVHIHGKDVLEDNPKIKTIEEHANAGFDFLRDKIKDDNQFLYDIDYLNFLREYQNRMIIFKIRFYKFNQFHVRFPLNKRFNLFSPSSTCILIYLGISLSEECKLYLTDTNPAYNSKLSPKKTDLEYSFPDEFFISKRSSFVLEIE